MLEGVSIYIKYIPIWTLDGVVGENVNSHKFQKNGGGCAA